MSKPYNQIDLFPVVIEPVKPSLSDLVVTNTRIDKKTGQLRADLEANTTTRNTPLITKEVYAKAFLRAAIEYMGNDVGAIIEETKLIYARMQAIAEVNKIVADGDKPDEKQFEAMVEQNLWHINYMMTNRHEVYQLRKSLAEQGQALLDDFPTSKSEPDSEPETEFIKDDESLELPLPDEETEEPKAA